MLHKTEYSRDIGNSKLSYVILCKHTYDPITCTHVKSVFHSRVELWSKTLWHTQKGQDNTHKCIHAHTHHNMVVVYFYYSTCAACLLVENFMQKHIIVFLKRACMCMHGHVWSFHHVVAHTHMKMGCFGFLARGVIMLSKASTLLLLFKNTTTCTQLVT